MRDPQLSFLETLDGTGTASRVTVPDGALETGRTRLWVTAIVFALSFLIVAGRLIDLTVFTDGALSAAARSGPAPAAVASRADIVDRNGVILATSLPTASLYADPGDVPDPEQTVTRLAAVLPGLDRRRALARLRSSASFVWLHRNLTPKQQHAVNRLGLPGLQFKRSERRTYPHGRAAAHVLGLTDVDGRGIAGVERFFDRMLTGGGAPVRLSIDLRVQSLLHRELAAAVDATSAGGAAGVVLDARTGEVLAMASLPDFDPNRPAETPPASRFNRATKGVYEMGSTFKLFTTAMALDSGTVSLTDGYDARQPIRVSRFTIADFHAKKRWLSVPEILVHSSNIGAAKMALDVGAETQQDYLRRLGLMSAAHVELPEVAAPLTPSRWREVNTMTVAFGHGIAVTPLQVAAATASVVNGGVHRPATIIRQPDGVVPAGVQVLTADTSRTMRGLMRLVVTHGTGRNADVAGYRVGGKTGTAEKQVGGGYSGDALVSSFVGAFPIEAPRYVVLVVLDEPTGTEETGGRATGGWVAAPVVGRIVSRLGPLVGLAPDPAPAPGGGKARLASYAPDGGAAREWPVAFE